MSVEDRTELLEQLRDAILQASNGRAKIAKFDEAALIIEDLGLYSLDILDLRHEVEDRWDFEIADEDIIRVRTVGDVIDLIERCRD